MFALLIPVLAQLPGLIGKFFSQKNEILTAQNQAQLQVELAKLQMAREIATSQLNLNATIIQSTAPFFKYFTFFMWFGPFMAGVIMPSLSKDIFLNLGGMPEWYVTSCIAIMFTVWGISVSAPVVNGIFSGLGEFFSARREYKVKLATLDEKKFFDVIKKGLGGSINEKTFNMLRAAIDTSQEQDHEVQTQGKGQEQG